MPARLPRLITALLWAAAPVSGSLRLAAPPGVVVRSASSARAPRPFLDPPAAYHRASVVADTNMAADTTPSLLLTPDLLQHVVAFVRQVQRQPAHLRTLADDSINYAHVHVTVGPFRDDVAKNMDNRALEILGVKTAKALLDLGAIAAKNRAIAAAFKGAHLTPAQYLPFVLALQRAEATDAMEIYLLENEGVQAEAAGDSATNVIWRNVAMLRAHRDTIDALGFPIPASLWVVTSKFTHFLDTTQHAARFLYVPDDFHGDPEDWPSGFMDSTNASSPTTAPPLRVLFIGNSLTQYNVLPRIFSELAAQGLHRRVVTGLVSLGGATPLRLLTETDLRQVMAAFPWDAVVVQMKPSRAFAYYAHFFRQASTAHHAQTVLWTQWLISRGDITEEDVTFHRQLDSTLTMAAKSVGATVAPIPQAWDLVMEQDMSVWSDLFLPAVHGHPSQWGSYLTALVLYRTLTGRSPVGLPRTLHSLSVGPVRTTDTLTVPTPVAALLQRAAATAQQ